MQIIQQQVINIKCREGTRKILNVFIFLIRKCQVIGEPVSIIVAIIKFSTFTK